MQSVHRYYAFALCGLLVVALSPFAADAEAISSQVSIAPNGQVIVRDAVLTAKSGTTLTASARWGKSFIEWTIQTSGSTRFYPDAESRESLDAMRVGDMLSFAGTLDGASPQLIVRAASVRDSSLLREGAEMNGTVLEVSDRSFSLSTLEGTTTVSVGTGTILTLAGEPIRVRDLELGDTVRALGRLNTLTNTLEAARLTVALRTEESELGIFSSILGWLGVGGRSISIR